MIRRQSQKTRTRWGRAADGCLDEMVLRRAITRYETNLHKMRTHGEAPAVKVWIWQRDELSIARVKWQIRDALLEGDTGGGPR